MNDQQIVDMAQCKLAIHIFAEHNFGPFGHIFFVIVLFYQNPKHYLECYFQAYVFRFSSFISVFTEYLYS
jgi:hypothetical protein